MANKGGVGEPTDPLLGPQSACQVTLYDDGVFAGPIITLCEICIHQERQLPKY